MSNAELKTSVAELRAREFIIVKNPCLMRIVLPFRDKTKKEILHGGRSTLLNFSEIEYINQTTKFFKHGMLEFDENDVNLDSIYNALRIPNWKEEIPFHSTIVDLILDPTPENIRKLISVENKVLFERIKGIAVYLYNVKGDRDNIPSPKLRRAIDARFIELQRAPLYNTKTKIVIDEQGEICKDSADLSVAVMQKQINQLEHTIKQLTGVSHVKYEVAPPTEEASNTKFRNRSAW